jgi:D-amino peptidase
MSPNRFALVALIVSAGCAPAPSSAPPAAGTVATPWTLTAVAPDTSDGIRILILHDMEGLAGQGNPTTFDFGTPRYPEGQQLLVGDINAVVEGLYAGGATEVRVVDGHGSGNPDPDVRTDLLDKRATQILRDEDYDGYFGVPEFERFDAVAVVGMHAKTGSRGFASHTFTLGIGIAINGQFVTETELVGLSWGRVGVPVIFGSGDDRLAADLATMPWIEFATVKTVLAADSAAPRPIAEARADLTAKAKRAVENLKAGKAQSMQATLPLKVGLRAVPPANLSHLAGLPGIQYADSTVTFPVDSLKHGYDVLISLVGIATREYTRLLTRALRDRPDGPTIMGAFQNQVSQTWFDYESGRWKAPPPPPPPAPRKHHGYQ